MMNLPVAITLFVLGLGLVISFAEKLVKGAVGTSAGFGVSAFIISVVFIGFDPENLAVGAVGSFEGVGGIALGSIIGAAMVAIALAFGITALIVPMSFEQVPRQILAVPVVALLVFAGVLWDGRLSRLDGGILLAAFVAGIAALFRMSRRGIDIRPTGEVAETLTPPPSPSGRGDGGEGRKRPGRWTSLGLLLVSLAAIIVGSELLVESSKTIMGRLGLSDTLFGMTILAFLVSVEEIARELPAAWKGRPEISYGNVVGSILAFFCFNAGIIALVRPVQAHPQVLRFYLPVCGVTVLLTTAVMLTRTVPRWAGGALVLLYILFAAGGFLGRMALPGG